MTLVKTRKVQTQIMFKKTLVKRELLRSHKHKVKEKHNEKAETRTKVKLVNEIMKVKRSLNKKLVRQKSQFSF